MAPVPTPVSAPATGETPYALSKLIQERLALATGRRTGIPTVALRYAITYGPRQSLFNPYTGVVSIFSTRLLNNLPPLLYEDGQQIRDFIFVEDVARANLHVMTESAADGRAFNVGSGIGVRMAELAHVLADTYERPFAPAVVGDYRPGDARHIIHDISELSDLGFPPPTPLSAGIKRFAAWIGSQGDVQEYFTEAHQKLRDCGVVQHVQPSE
jgi:dTDP-L-rhamnose 4-epimerase